TRSLSHLAKRSWFCNASTEVCRAISMAMPILCKARHVMLLIVEGSISGGPSAKDALVHLEAHGITATEKTVGARGQRPGEVILAEARAQGSDLLIKGAYTKPFAPNDLRRRNPARSRGCRAAGVPRALRITDQHASDRCNQQSELPLHTLHP